MKKLPDYRDKNILVMGLGLHGGGVGTVNFLVTHGARSIIVTDQRSKRALKPSLKALAPYKGITYVLGRHRLKDFERADMIIKNPGVRPDSAYLAVAIKRGIPITTDIGIFFRHYNGRIIAITGTRGKSTTAHLITTFLKTKFRGVYLGGNIRTSVFELLSHVKKTDWAILELSSFQLEDLGFEARYDKSARAAFVGKPHIAIITNIMRDHLNWHNSLREYKRAKQNIFLFQKNTNYIFINKHDEVVNNLIAKAKSRIVKTTLPKELENIVEKKLGIHYLASVGIAVGVARQLKISIHSIEKCLKNLHGLEGRQERLGVIHGITIINDTTSTTPDATIAAIDRYHNHIKSPAHLILIAGGTDKNLDFRKMIARINTAVDVLILLPGSATDIIKHRIKSTTYTAANMKSAVKTALKHSRIGDYIVLSPGATSFGLFLNEFDRGAQFVHEVNKLQLKTK